jgi:hypothetical protein
MPVSNQDDVIDLRDVIAEVESLELEPPYTLTAEQQDHLRSLNAFLAECKGKGGDEQWRDAWYPVTAIRDSYFVDYTEELVKDIGDLPKNIPNYIVIDWEATAENILADYTSVEFNDVTYWVR